MKVGVACKNRFPATDLNNGGIPPHALCRFQKLKLEFSSQVENRLLDIALVLFTSRCVGAAGRTAVAAILSLSTHQKADISPGSTSDLQRYQNPARLSLLYNTTAPAYFNFFLLSYRVIFLNALPPPPSSVPEMKKVIEPT